MPRTRSETAHKKVVQAALKLVAERGVDATSMDAIAAASGVSKATIYKHWADKEALLLEMMATFSGLHSRPAFDSGNTRADMIAVLAYRPKENTRMRERLTPHFVAYSARNVEFGHAWRNLVTEPPRRELKHLIAQGVAKGELAVSLDMDLCLALLLGPVLYWHIFLRKTNAEARVLAEGVVEVFWRAFALETDSPATIGQPERSAR
jgi:AcrR family transcriptional regulator